MVFCQSAAGDNAMHMHVVIHFLVPGMENLNDPGRRAEILRVRSQFEECFGTAFVKEPVEKFLVTIERALCS